MLTSVTKCFLCCITRPCRNKIVIENHSNVVVQYEAYIYRGASVSKIDGGIGAMGVDANLTMEIVQKEGLKPSTGRIQPNGKAIETCDYGGRISLRYKFEGLDWDYSPELRNFGVLDTVQILPLSKEERTRRINLLLEMETRKKLAEDIKRKCSSDYPHMCSAGDTPKKQCKLCEDWYCNHHAEPKSKWSVFGGMGGHVCNKL